ncbi:MAG: hypothetical protein BGO59_24140 [Spirosoma sp. 48-14]|nr:MAG: hypothetical protein BGO59_24140 [Spirosoma sp. 48-14]
MKQIHENSGIRRNAGEACFETVKNGEDFGKNGEDFQKYPPKNVELSKPIPCCTSATERDGTTTSIRALAGKDRAGLNPRIKLVLWRVFSKVCQVSSIQLDTLY